MAYPSYNKKEFPSILNKYEFDINKPTNTRNFMYQEPNQILMRNFIAQHTPYENILLFHGLGTGKTCNSISIAEGFKEYIYNMGRRIVVLVKNKNIQANFINEIQSKCTYDNYKSDENENVVKRLINKTYQFITYGSFVNQVLGMKMYETVENDGNLQTKLKTERTRKNSELQNFNNCVIIIDEAHNVTNNDVYVALKTILSKSYNYRLILLTGTPIYDNTKEIFELSNLLNISNQHLQLPIRNELFKQTSDNKQYVEKIELKNNLLKGGIIRVTEYGKKVLENALYGKVSYLRPNIKTNPRKIEMGNDNILDKIGTTKIVYCKMSNYQYSCYLTALQSDVKSDSKIDITSIINELETQEADEPTDSNTTIKSSLYKNSSDASTMCYPNKLFGKIGYTSVFDSKGNIIINNDKTIITTNLKKYSNKLYKMLQNINRQGNVFIYSNYVSYGGTTLVKQILKHNGYKEFNGQIGDKQFIIYDENQSAKTLRLFNSEKNKNGDYIKILIGSPLISEGITLKNVRQVHILEPSWNMSRINQIIGRCVRNNSHKALSPENRYVEIYKYVSVFTPSPEIVKKSPLTTFFIDHEKYILSEQKDRSNKQVERLLKEIGFDCDLMKTRNNSQSTDVDYSPECDYSICEYKCKIHKTNNTIDKSTYNFHINTIDKYDIEYINTILKKLFKEYFIWKLDDIIDYIKQLEPHVSNESIYTVLSDIVNSKRQFVDMYNRPGFIINKGPYYIFNDLEIDINSSIYTKILDFSQYKTKYNLGQYVEKISNGQQIFTEIVEQKQRPQIEKLSSRDINYNNNIMNTSALYGTYRDRPIEDELFGPIDSKFRIVDNRKNKQLVTDKRKAVTGISITSITKPNLVDIAKFLKINKKDIENYKKIDIAEFIEKTLIERKQVLV